ncbi:MAG: c-type cytochrome [Rheinheimera sp.]
MKKLLITSAVLASLSLPLFAGSAFTDAEDAIEYRKAGFQLIRHNMMDLGDMIRGNVPYDAARVQKRANALAALTTLPWEAFTVPGADKASGDAKAEIWANLQDFNSRADSFQQDAVNLQTAAKGGEQAAVKAAFAAFAKNCKACHDQYKAD